MTDRTCLIVDDEPLARQLLEGYVQRCDSLRLAGSYGNPIEALRFLRAHPVDLLFLDVQMNGLTGLQVAEIVGGTMAIVLTTAFERYALAGYDLDVSDYLLKPISFERFQRAVDKVVAASSASPKISDTPAASSYIFVKSGYQLQRVDLDTIHYLSGSGDYVTIFLRDGSKLLTLENMSSFVERLPPKDFCRIHRSHIVALDKIDFVERNRVVIDGEYLKISQSYAEDFLARINGR